MRKEDVDNLYPLLQLEWIPSKSLDGACCKDNILQWLCWLEGERGELAVWMLIWTKEGTWG